MQSTAVFFLRPAMFARERADARSVYSYPAPAHPTFGLSEGAHVTLRRFALRVPVLVVDAPAAVLVGLGVPTGCLVKVLLDRCSSLIDGTRKDDRISVNVHGLGPICHPLALAVTNRILPSVALVLDVTLLARLIGAAGVLIADKVIREVKRRGLERWSVTKQNTRRVVSLVLT